MREPLVLATTLFGIAVLVACSTTYPPCYRGEYQGCACANGAHGYQACNVTEDGFQSCVCDGTTPGLDGGRDASGEASLADAATPGTYLAPCDPAGACTGAGAVCFAFMSRGTICTKTCTQDTECPAPSPGCSPMNGVCKGS